MGGGDVKPTNIKATERPPGGSPDAESATSEPVASAPAATQDSQEQSLAGAFQFIGSFFQPLQIQYPAWAPDEFVEAAKQEAAAAAEDLPQRSSSWQNEKRESAAAGRSPKFEMKFVYAWTCLKCRSNEDQRRGLLLMEELIEFDNYPHTDECAYALAHANYMRSDLKEARRWCEALLRMKPDSDRAQKLHGLIRTAQSVKQEQTLEAAAVGGAVILGVAGIALAFAAGGGGKRR
jgi:hypothetical protein